MEAFQAGEDSEARWNSEALPSHMFRDTFAVELLLAGVPLDQVSLLLDHSSVKITERHYAPFCKAQQEQPATSVKLAWKKPTQSLHSVSHESSPPSRPFRLEARAALSRSLPPSLSCIIELHLFVRSEPPPSLFHVCSFLCRRISKRSISSRRGFTKKCALAH